MASPISITDSTPPDTSVPIFLPPQDPALTRESFTRLFQDMATIGHLIWHRESEIASPAMSPLAFHRYCLEFTERVEKVCQAVHLQAIAQLNRTAPTAPQHESEIFTPEVCQRYRDLAEQGRRMRWAANVRIAWSGILQNLVHQQIPLPPNTPNEHASFSTLFAWFNDAAQIPFFTQVTTLSLRGQGLVEIPMELFSKFVHLQRLDLIDNRIQTIDFDTLRFFPQLDTLILAGNELQEIPDNAFTALSNLRILNLSSNHRLKKIPTDLPRGLEALILRGMDLEEIPETAFRELRYLHSLDLSANFLTSIPDRTDLFPPSLEELRLAVNEIRTIPKRPFQHLRNLQLLDCSQNQITGHLPPGLLRGLTSLKWLFFQENQITEIPEFFFQGLKDLREIDFSENYLSHLPQNVFCHLSHLRTLNFESNRLMKWPSHLLKNLFHLKSIDLSYNRLHEVPSNLQKHCPHLQHLVLNQNPDLIEPSHFTEGFAELQSFTPGSASSAYPRSIPEIESDRDAD